MIPNSYSSRRNSQRHMQDRASSSSTSSSRSPQSLDEALSAAARSTAGTSRSSSRTSRTFRASQETDSRSNYPGVYRQPRGMWTTVNGGLFSTQEEAAWALNRERGEHGLSRLGPPRVSRSSLAREENRSEALSRVSQSNIFENSSGRSVDISADDRSFYQNAASYMTSPTYMVAGIPDDSGLDRYSGGLDQLSLARRLTGQFDNEYRDQEYGSRSRHDR